MVALCAAQRARRSSNRGETARDRKFGRPRNGLARARRGVTRDDAVARRCELISLFSVRTLFSKTLVLYKYTTHTIDSKTLDKSYMMVPFIHEVTIPTAYKWLFDVGASTYNKGAGGASQSWFVDTYRKHGIEFDRIIGWEAKQIDPNKQWSTVPADIKRKTSWYNIPAKAVVGDPDNPLTFIKELTKAEDYVVFKLDIDTPAVEVALVQQLMDDEDLLELIDEFYFEHHVSGSPMQWHGWGNLTTSKVTLGRIEDSYNIFTFLRERGVRAHSWV